MTPLEKLKAALAHEAANPDFSQPTPAEAARKLAEQMERDKERARIEDLRSGRRYLYPG